MSSAKHFCLDKGAAIVSTVTTEGEEKAGGLMGAARFFW
jgi:hypothetical protein